MRALVGGLMAGLSLAGCGPGGPGTGSDQTGCASQLPDGGACVFEPGVQCAVGWSCDSDQNHFAISCKQTGSGLSCTCCTEGVPGRQFGLPSVTCDPNLLLQDADMGCGWSLTQ